MSGLELAERLQPLRTLFISGYSAEARRRPLPAGSAFLEKPFDHGALLAEVRALLDALHTIRVHDRREHGLRRAGRAPPARGPGRLADDRHPERASRSRRRCGSGGTARRPCASSACPTPAACATSQDNPSVSLNFAGNGHGGDIVILSGEATIGDDSAADQLAPTRRSTPGASSASASPPEQFAAALLDPAAHPPHQGPRPQVIRRADSRGRRRPSPRLLIAFRDWWGSSTPADEIFRGTVARLLDGPEHRVPARRRGPGRRPAALPPRAWTGTEDCWLEDVFVTDARPRHRPRQGAHRGRDRPRPRTRLPPHRARRQRDEHPRARPLREPRLPRRAQAARPHALPRHEAVGPPGCRREVSENGQPDSAPRNYTIGHPIGTSFLIPGDLPRGCR